MGLYGPITHGGHGQEFGQTVFESVPPVHIKWLQEVKETSIYIQFDWNEEKQL